MEDKSVYYKNPVYPPLGGADRDFNWRYALRRSCQEILPGLYLGPYASATRLSKDNMVALGLTHVVCVRSKDEKAFIRPNHTECFQYLLIEMNDTLCETVIPNLKIVIKFLDDCFNSGGRALVHGNAGMSRSAAIVVGYVMWRHGVDAKTAFKFVQGKRFCVELNASFMSQLRDFEMMAKAIHVVPKRLPGQVSNKRSAEDEAEGSAEKIQIQENMICEDMTDEMDIPEPDLGMDQE